MLDACFSVNDRGRQPLIKHLTFCLLCLCVALSAQANTRLYGYANGFAQTRTVSDGTALEVTGYLTELGFRNSTPVTPELKAGFDLNLGLNLLDSWSPYMRRGDLSLEGRWGTVALFYGETPLSETNQWLTLMHQDPDNLPLALDFAGASPLRLPQGVTAVDGLRYRTPLVGSRVQLSGALMPAEQIGGETGYSVTLSWLGEHFRSLAGIELNGAYGNAQLGRWINEYRSEAFTLGLLLQATHNTLTEAQGQSVMLYSQHPWSLGEQSQRLKLTLSANHFVDQDDERRLAFYSSLVNQVVMSESFSLYGFAEAKWESETPAFTLYTGAGASLGF
ncbi:nucleoid occlusion protein [Reinekea sp. MED297]|uniref:Nucleoid occlusion protein n=2 Tax=Reinekea TaxID=230494 RepID=A4BAA0_9GAMM|nr:nucleoid occlusion protein [Reinekea sp. MED297] [Reinekea blandensis MED297]